MGENTEDSKNLYKLGSLGKYQISDLFNPSSVELVLCILHNTADVHRVSATKHPPFKWEGQLNRDTDCTWECNLDAMLRHLSRYLAGELIDPESNLSHLAHVFCRWQMFVTAVLRCDLYKHALPIIDGHLTVTYNTANVNDDTFKMLDRQLSANQVHDAWYKDGTELPEDPQSLADQSNIALMNDLIWITPEVLQTLRVSMPKALDDIGAFRFVGILEKGNNDVVPSPSSVARLLMSQVVATEATLLKCQLDFETMLLDKLEYTRSSDSLGIIEDQKEQYITQVICNLTQVIWFLAFSLVHQNKQQSAKTDA